MTRTTEREKIVAEEEAIHELFPYLTRAVFSRVRFSPAETHVVDLGGGSGLWLEAFRKAGTAAGFLIDIDTEDLQFAATRWRRLGVSEYQAIAARAEGLPLHAESINLAVSRNSLHLWQNIPLALENLARVLKKGGCAFLGRGFGPDLPDDVREKVKNQRKEYQTKYYPEDDRPPEPPSPPQEDLISLLKRVGFASVEIIPDHKAWWALARR